MGFGPTQLCNQISLLYLLIVDDTIFSVLFTMKGFYSIIIIIEPAEKWNLCFQISCWLTQTPSLPALPVRLIAGAGRLASLPALPVRLIAGAGRLASLPALPVRLIAGAGRLAVPSTASLHLGGWRGAFAP